MSNTEILPAESKLKEIVTEAVKESPVPATVHDERTIAAAVVEKVAEDPVALNAFSQEPWYQSRVANYGSAIVIVSAIKVGAAIMTNGLNLPAYNAMEMGFDLLILWGALGVLYGRFAPGLKPMWHRLFGGR